MSRVIRRTLLALGLLLLSVNLHAQTVDKPFVALTVANFGAASLDIAATRRCIDEGTCREGNPLLGPSLFQETSVSFGIAAGQTILSYELKKHNNSAWKIVPIVGIGVHSFGAAWALHF